MATFEAQVEGLTSLSIDGSSAPTQTELTQFLTDGAKEVINVLPANLIDLCAASQSFTSGTASTLNTGKVLRVFRSDGDIKQPCRKVDAMQKGRFSDSEDMNYATVTDPIYYIENNSLDILPVGGSATYSEVQYPSVAYGDSAILVFPDEAEYLVPLYAAVKSLQNAMGNKTSDLPTDLSIVASPPVIPSSPSFNTGAISISSSAPSYIKTPLSIGDAPTISDLSIAAVPPDVPTITVSTVSFSTTAPSYSSPLTTISGTVWATAYPDEYSAIDTALTAITTEVGLAKTEVLEIVSQTDNSSTFNTALTAIATELNKVDNVIAEASTEFDEAKDLSAAYNSGQIATALDAIQANVDLANGIIDAPPTSPTAPPLTSVTFTSIDSALDAVNPVYTTATIGSSSTYTGSAPTFTKPVVSPDFSQVNTYIDTDEDVELAQAKLQEINAQLSEYSANIQSEQAEFNKENVLYQSAIQESTQELQIVNQVNLAKAQSDLQVSIGNKDRDQQRQLQNGVNDMQAIIQNNDDLMSRYSAEVTEYQAKLGEMTQRAQGYLNTAQGYSNEVQSYAAAGQTFISTGSAYIQEAQSYIAQAGGYAQEVNARGGFTTAKSQAVQGFIQTAQNYANEVQALLSQTSMKVSEYQSKLQDALNEFNDDNAEYQAQLQISIQNAQLEDADDGKKLQKYSAELQQYQAEVAAEVQEYQQNLQGDVQVWQIERQTDLQKHSSDIQDELNEFNKEQTIYQNELQEKIQEANNQQTKDSSEYGADLQKYSNELQSYQAQINKEVQEFTNNIQKHTANYQWIDSQHQKLSADYQRGVQILMGGGVMPQQQGR